MIIEDKSKPSRLTVVKKMLLGKYESESVQSQIGKDAEARSKAATITYRRALGASLRKNINMTRQAKFRTFGGIVFIYYFIMIWLTSAHSSLLTVFWLLFGGLLCGVAAVIAPEDMMYLDRLSLIVPEKNILTIAPKILWGQVEEIAIIDTAVEGKKSDFALQLKEISGTKTDILLSALENKGLKTLSDYIRTYAPHIRGLAQLNDIERFLNFQNGNLPQISYTQLWESANKANFGLTAFTPLAPGAKIQETFTVVRQLAAGGFAAIYLIEEIGGELFVLKESVLPTTLDETSRTKAAEQFQREASILSRLNHPQIARVYDHFVENGRNYMRLEYITGSNLRQHAAHHTEQTESICLDWATQLAKILKYLHELTPPVVHRDLSPDNVVLKENGQLVLIDFGAANEFIGQATGTLVGKHAYMAPEQIRGNAEPASDVYALGACVYFALTGQDPEPLRTIIARANGANISESLDNFITKCTKLDRSERFASAQECLEYLLPSGKQSG